MSFQNRLLISYSVVIVLLLSVLGFIFYKYSSNALQKTAYDNMTVIGEKMAWQLDNLVRPMDFITVNLIATDNFIRSMSSLANIDRASPDNGIYINEATRYIYVTLCNDSINKNFYSVNMFNRNGDFFSSRIQVPNIDENAGNLIRSFSWLADVDALQGKPFLVPPHLDPWNDKPVGVFSLVRAVRGDRGNVGYLEVQVNVTELEDIISIPSHEGLRVAIMTGDNKVFYHSMASQGDWVIASDNEVVQEFPTEITGFKIVLVQDRNVLLKPLTYTLRAAALVGLAVVAASVLTIFALSRRLVKPIRQLKQQVESTELETLAEKLPTVTSGDELVALANSFMRLRERLSDSVARELRLQSLQMQANFDFLQAQINPHFLYNILNVLSQKGMEIGDDEVCEISTGIASMLRYSTSTKERVATIKDEINHIRTYLSLMKKRYEDRLDFSFEVDERVLDCAIPKIVLQQLVENSIEHSFTNGYRFVRVDIVCKKSDQGWDIEIRDNGPGFTHEKLEQLTCEFEKMRDNIVKASHGFAIGGMGLVNTYARLWLHFRDTLIFEPGNNPNGGARILLSVIAGGDCE